ncbi:MAG TPA: DoxX family protein [Rhizomicrobium sp.]|nr:DoxX family protein [Rhizomicrobium sp.]
MSISETISPFLGRLILAWFFLSEAWWRIRDWEGTVMLMHMKHVANAEPLLALAVVLMALGGISLLLGYYARTGALILFALTIIMSVLIHDYWKISNSVDRDADYDLFIRNMAIAGGLLFLVGMGPGPFAIDQPAKKKR